MGVLWPGGGMGVGPCECWPLGTVVRGRSSHFGRSGASENSVLPDLLSLGKTWGAWTRGVLSLFKCWELTQILNAARLPH